LFPRYSGGLFKILRVELRHAHQKLSWKHVESPAERAIVACKQLLASGSGRLRAGGRAFAWTVLSCRAR